MRPLELFLPIRTHRCSKAMTSLTSAGHSERRPLFNATACSTKYAMGLVDQTQVPPFFYVENPTSVSPPRTATSNPEVGVTFSGTRRTVTIEDVIAVHGQRAPSAADIPRVYRQAFVYVV
jgi:hypothetical protein